MADLPRRVTTVDDIESLPTGAVLIDNTNHAWVKGDSQWWSSHPYDGEHLNSPLKMRELLLVYLPHDWREHDA